MNSPDEYQTSFDRDQSAAARRDAARTLEELLLCATAFDRSTSPSTDSEEWFRAESESLLQWAKDTGRFLSPVEYGRLISGFKFLDGGLEHQVFWKKRNGRIFKITKPPHFGDSWELKNYVQNVIWCNAVFDDDMRLEGVIQTADGVSLVMSQPYIVGNAPTEEQIRDWFELQGCVLISPQKWRYPDGMVVNDAHTGNLILMKDGNLIPVDLHIQKLGSF